MDLFKSALVSAPAVASAVSSAYNRAVNARNASPEITSGGASLSNALNMLNGYADISDMRTDASIARQMDFQREQNEIAMAYNAAEAQKNRNWQTEMSNTAHLREMADLKAAGLNPVLAANNGASVGSASTASISGQSGASSDAVNRASIASNLFGQLLSSWTQQQNMATSAKTSLEIAKLQQDTSKFLGALSAETSRYNAELGFKGTKYSSDTHLQGVRESSTIGLEQALQVAGIQAATAKAVAQSNFVNSTLLQEDKQKHEYLMESMFPSGGVYGFLNSLLNDLSEEDFGRLGKVIKNLQKFAGNSGKSNFDWSHGWSYGSMFPD